MFNPLLVGMENNHILYICEGMDSKPLGRAQGQKRDKRSVGQNAQLGQLQK